MPVYEYTALDAKGKSKSGIIDADGTSAARQKLRSTGIFPVSIKETQELLEKKAPRTLELSRYFSRVKPAEIAMMTRQLATLISAGFPLVSALDALLPQTKSHGFKRTLAQIKDAIVEGQSFAQALSQYPGVFTPLYINMVRAGETSGTLEIVLDRLADITEKQQDLKNRIQTALAYPILMCIIGILVLFVLLTYIVPSIISIFTEMNQVLPTPTRIFYNLLVGHPGRPGRRIFGHAPGEKDRERPLLVRQNHIIDPGIGCFITKTGGCQIFPDPGIIA
jgi:general secretion pathway protein F